MVIECCGCLKPKVEDEYKPEKTEKKVMENQDIGDISTDSKADKAIDKTMETKIISKVNGEEYKGPKEPKIQEKVQLKNDTIDVCVIDNKFMYINGSNNGILSDCSLSDNWNMEFIKFDMNNIRFSNTMVVENVGHRFNAMKLVCGAKGAYTTINGNKIFKSYIDFFYDSSLRINADLTGDVFIKTDAENDIHLIYIFNLNNKIIIKELSVNDKLNMFKLHDNYVSFDDVIKQESSLELFVSNLSELIDAFSEKFHIVIVNCSC
jgi:hypothetical protein